jgi:hypothetical protein
MQLEDELEALVPLGIARRKIIPRNTTGRPISPATIWRWIHKGLENRVGERICLRVVMVGSRPYVSRAAIEDFFARLTKARAREIAEPELTSRSPSQEERLRAAGLL